MKRILTFLSIIIIIMSSCTDKGGFNLKLIPVKSGDKWGYIDNEGKYAINPQFEKAYLFFDGLALVKANDGKYGFIGEDGKYKINPIYKEAHNYFSAEGLVCVVQENESPKFIDKEGKVVFTVNNADIVGQLNDGLAKVKIKNKWGFIDATGTIKINPEYDDASTFNEGLAGVAKKDEKTDELKWGFINKDGKLIINFQFSTNSADNVLSEFSSVSGLNFSDGLAPVSNDGKKWGYISKEGKYEINPQFDKAFSFSNGYALVKQGEQYGYIDKQGKFTINPQFISAFSFSSDNIAPVQNTDKKWGFIDNEGKYIINPQFDEVLGNFYSGIAIVKSFDKFGIINEKGAYQVNSQFDELYIQDLYLFNNVSSDYLDAPYMANQILEGTTDTSFRNISANTTLNEILKLHPNQTEDDLDLDKLTVTLPNDIEFADNTLISTIQYFFYNNTYINKPVYETVRKYNFWLGAYYNDKEFSHYEKNYNSDAKTIAVTYSFVILKTGKTKSKQLTDELKDQFIKKSRLDIREHKEIKNTADRGMYILKGEDLYVKLDYGFIEIDKQNFPMVDVVVVLNDLNVDIEEYEKDWIKSWKENQKRNNKNNDDNIDI